MERTMRADLRKMKKCEHFYKMVSDDTLKSQTKRFQTRIAAGETLDEILPEAYALVKEAAFRVLGMRHYEEQVMGGIVLHRGEIAEMKTGEGKTLVATLPAYLNALSGKGVHVVTVNDYLAKRDAETMGKVHEFLGLSVGVVLQGMTTKERKEAYGCDITYVTNSELGFDYLRDNMATKKSDVTLRGLHYAIIDEIDSILIDEARTPMIISGKGSEASSLYEKADLCVKRMGEEGFEVDEEKRRIVLTEEGERFVEVFFGVDKLMKAKNIAIYHHVVLALQARHLMKRDIDYVVREGEIELVDEFTGRIMNGRRFSGGLHQAIEAKEKVEIHDEGMTAASISYQSLFNKYEKKSGMTGTGKSDEKELKEFYKLSVRTIPTHRPVLRNDRKDIVYRTKEMKYQAILASVEKIHRKGQPILIGTPTIEVSQEISEMLKDKHLKHEVLNAKNHEKEAEIIAKAGRLGAITIATNMAGRGTDIKLEEKAKALGGLYVIGAERSESRRVDDQLIGRAGRQGDPGDSEFYLSLEDDLFHLYVSEKEMKSLQRKRTKDGRIQSRQIEKILKSAQKKVEADHYSVRKQLMDYDRIMDEQREIIYAGRNQILENREHKQSLEQKIVLRVIDTYWTRHINEMECLRKGIGLQAYGQKDPRIEYREMGYRKFENMLQNIRETTTRALVNV